MTSMTPDRLTRLVADLPANVRQTLILGPKDQGCRVCEALADMPETAERVELALWHDAPTKDSAAMAAWRPIIQSALPFDVQPGGWVYKVIQEVQGELSYMRCMAIYLAALASREHRATEGDQT